MTIDFYYMPASAPCRAVLLTAKAVGVELNLKHLDILKQEQLSEEFVKINPQHTIPTMDDNGFVLWESRAISMYLIEQYAKDDKLYPKDIKQRALINQRLYFDMGTLYVSFGEYYYPIILNGQSPDPEKYKKIEQTFELVNKFLEGQDYLAGNHLTVADLSIVATISTFDAVNFDVSQYDNVAKWYERVKKNAPGYEEANAKNVALMKQLFEERVRK